MAVIKNLAFFDKKKLYKLTSFAESGLKVSEFGHFPLDLIHGILPFKLKFLEESFVSLENKKITGLVSVIKAGAKRVKISKIFIEKDSLQAGKLLINYIVDTYLGKGAESFYVVCDKNNTSLISIIQQGCGFQRFAKELVYSISKKDSILNYEDLNFEHIRPARISDAEKINDLINKTMFSYQRATFCNTISDFKKNFFAKNKQFVVLDRQKNSICGYFAVTMVSESDYSLELVLDVSYEIFVSDIVNYAKTRLQSEKNFKTLYVRLRSYFANFKELKEIADMEYSKSCENEIFVKTYLLTLKKQDFSYGDMSFNDPTPAF